MEASTRCAFALCVPWQDTTTPLCQGPPVCNGPRAGEDLWAAAAEQQTDCVASVCVARDSVWGADPRGGGGATASMATFAQHVAQGLTDGLSRAEAERRARDMLFDEDDAAAGCRAAPRALTSNFNAGASAGPPPPFGGSSGRPLLPPHPTARASSRPPAAPDPTSQATQSSSPTGDEVAALALQRAFRGFRGRERFAWMIRERARQLKEKQRAKVGQYSYCRGDRLVGT